ncbi:MAG: heat-inducible transcriptional repressor HrcA [Aurantimonas coralicida]|jgi:heat-inducible transcriptional repressor|uniref:heat-inducible transcriptional repressor HrcA n=1 Tax=Aurantimonas TaxID=182269 RepID=UPI000422DAEA|nr:MULTISPECIES: heat-inducible transcriptional repressor HrcA [Aurantimonas]MAP18273.1 heat-inducible transcriptional repressor HrcA [Aurantimonas sp.]MCW7544671.1 heat-inducible transcriptional repressor HrcA [Aurantimonas litoralis]MBC6715385.1 heat-inducible transcriptional repressor HrcA [Aurantimonas sp. DM33-3]MCC4296796.1 heat-inducible transcriptional repressor HrcA [Aurantimonas coralicida]MCD1644355.1 heat-inducible transcriptional repressor HrcA [Aurantimonas coralicida]
MTEFRLPVSDLASGALPLDERSREIFRLIVESYLDIGEPVGSRMLSRLLTNALSPASIRNVMSDLEALGLIYAPHVSAGRMPTELGLRFFVDAFLEVGDLGSSEREEIEEKVRVSGDGRPFESLLTEASQLLSGLSRGAGIVLTSKADLRLKHIEFIRLEPTRALAVLVGANGEVENRILDLPAGVTASQLVEAGNFLNAHIVGRTLGEASEEIARLKDDTSSALDLLSRQLVEKGLAVWSGASADQPARLIVRGRANLLENVTASEDIERLRLLFDDLETKSGIIELLGLAEKGNGVRIFIGSENKLFSLSGSSLVVAPYQGGGESVIGAVGVIGPTRLNYKRIVPMVDYTARIVSRLLTSGAAAREA